jgi:ABC-type cobalt transport system, permease component CbiQ and related transporters
MYILGQYIPQSSVISRLDPRVKILSLVVLSFAILRADGWTVLLVSLFWSLVLYGAHLMPTRLFQALKPLLFFFVLLFSLHLFFSQGAPLFPGHPWLEEITWEGLYRGALVTWQFAALVVGSSLLTMTTTASELICGVERLLRPLNRIGLPSHDLAMMISLALRFVPTVLDEFNRVKKAQMARGMDFGRGDLFGASAASPAWQYLSSWGP